MSRCVSKQVKFSDSAWFVDILHRRPICWVYGPLRQFWRKLARSVAYARIGWNNYDFDSGYVLQLLLFKLERLQNYLLTQGHTVQDKTTLQSLRLAIKLLNRLTNDNYSYFYDRHNAKWNPTNIPMRFEKIENTELSEMVTFRHSLPAEVQAQESDELRAAFDADDALKTRDSRWCFNIIAKYYAHWWD